MDPRFCSLVSYVSFRILQATSADAEFRMTIGPQSGGVQIPQILESGLQVAISSTVSNSEVNRTMKVQPLMMPGAGQAGQVRLDFLNVDTDTYNVSMYIYLFNIRVRELTSMGQLLWARGAT